MIEKNFVNNVQLGFKANDSCAHQLASITFCTFETNPSLKVSGIFLIY